MGHATPFERLLKRASAALLLVLAIAHLSAAEESDRKSRDSYLDAYVASHGSAPPPDSAYASPSHPAPTYAAPAPSYGPPHRAYPHPPHHHLHHHAYGPPVLIAGGGDYGPDNGNGNEMQGNGGSGGVDIATFLHALGKILVVKIIIKLVAVIIALLFLPKIKEKKKKKKPYLHKPHRPQQDDDDSDDDEDDDDDDRRRRRRALGGKVRGFGTSPGDPRIIYLAQWVLQSIEDSNWNNDVSASDLPTSDRPVDS